MIDNAQRNTYEKSGVRIKYKDRFRGQDVILEATIICKISSRSGSYYRILPDRLEQYGNITHFERSISADMIVKE